MAVTLHGRNELFDGKKRSVYLPFSNSKKFEVITYWFRTNEQTPVTYSMIATDR